MSIFKKLGKLAKKGGKLALKNPEIALMIVGVVSPKIARKAKKIIDAGEATGS